MLESIDLLTPKSAILTHTGACQHVSKRSVNNSPFLPLKSLRQQVSSAASSPSARNCSRVRIACRHRRPLLFLGSDHSVKVCPSGSGPNLLNYISLIIITA